MDGKISHRLIFFYYPTNFSIKILNKIMKTFDLFLKTILLLLIERSWFERYKRKRCLHKTDEFLRTN